MKNNVKLPRNNKERIIIGAYEGGLKLARMLSASRFQVDLIDKLNLHQLQHLFEQVATSFKEQARS